MGTCSGETTVIVISVSFLHLWISTLTGKELAPVGAHSFPVRVDTIVEWLCCLGYVNRVSQELFLFAKLAEKCGGVSVHLGTVSVHAHF